MQLHFKSNEGEEGIIRSLPGYDLHGRTVFLHNLPERQSRIVLINYFPVLSVNKKRATCGIAGV
jgi:hypothetical protein